MNELCFLNKVGKRQLFIFCYILFRYDNSLQAEPLCACQKCSILKKCFGECKHILLDQCI